MNVGDTIARAALFKSGAPTTAAIGLGAVPGNQIFVMSPRVQYTGLTPNNRNDLMAETLPFECAAPDASIILAVA